MRRALFIFLLLVLLILAWYFLIYQRNRSSTTGGSGASATPTLTSQPVQGASTTPTPATAAATATPLSTANWRSFGSSASNFSFRFPPEWVLTNLTPHAANGPYGGSIIERFTLTDLPLSNANARLDFESSYSNSVRDLETLGNCNNENVLSCSNVNLNGYTFKKVATKTNLPYPLITYYTIINDKILVFRSQITKDDKLLADNVNAVFNSLSVPATTIN